MNLNTHRPTETSICPNTHIPKNYHEIEDYLMSLRPNDIKIISGEISLEDIETAAAETRFIDDRPFYTNMVIETPKYKIKLDITASSSGGSHYGFVDNEIDIEFSVSRYIDKVTNQHFKVNYTQPYISKHRNFEYDMQELLGLL